MLPRLQVRTWLPVLHWIEHSAKCSQSSYDLTDVERQAILRYVLTDHFFAGWDPLSDALLRDMLDIVKACAERGESFPDASYLLKQLEHHTKRNNKDNAWLKVVSISDGNGGERTLALPLTAEQMRERFERHCNRYNLVPYDDGQLWFGNRWIDLLMWSQREALDAWFRPFSRDLALFGEAGRPWDYDHIVPSDFFNHFQADPQSIRLALNEIHRDLTSDNWEKVRGWRGRVGNYRIWPLGFNRRDVDMSADEKLTRNKEMDSYIVLSNWWNENLNMDPLALARASAIDLPEEGWRETPPEKLKWSEEQLVAFMKAVRKREETLYGRLIDFIWPGFDKVRARNTNRL